MRALLLCAVVSCVLVAAVPVHASPACGSYAYAGVRNAEARARSQRGDRGATGPGREGRSRRRLGRGRSKNADGWIQVGLSAFPGSTHQRVYLEYAAPGRDPQYTVLRPASRRRAPPLRRLRALEPPRLVAGLGRRLRRPAGRCSCPAATAGGVHRCWARAGTTIQGRATPTRTASTASARAGAEPAAGRRSTGFTPFEDAGYALSWRSASHFIASALARALRAGTGSSPAPAPWRLSSGRLRPVREVVALQSTSLTMLGLTQIATNDPSGEPDADVRLCASRTEGAARADDTPSGASLR